MRRTLIQDVTLPPLVRAEVLLGIRRAAAELGANLGPLLAKHGIDRFQISQPAGYIEKPKLVCFLQAVADRYDCPYFGFLVGKYQPPMSFGPSAELITLAPSLGTALSNIVRFAHLYTESVDYDVVVNRHSARFCRRNTYQYDIAPIQLDLLGTVQVFKVFQGLCGSDWTPNLVYLDHASYPDIETLTEFFGCPVIFGASFIGIEFPREDLARRLPTADAELLEVLEAWFSAKTPRQDNEVVNWVNKYIRLTLGMGVCNLEDCAHRLSVNQRTLQRELAASGCDFRQLVLEMRINLAQDCLLSSSVTLSRIADILGYNNASAFSRAFRKRTGLSPLNWRKMAQGRPALSQRGS